MRQARQRHKGGKSGFARSRRFALRLAALFSCILAAALLCLTFIAPAAGEDRTSPPVSSAAPSSPSPAAGAGAPFMQAAPLQFYGPPLPLKRKFINSGVLKPKIKTLPPQAPEFPPFSDSVFVPKFFDSHERFERADLSGISRLRFLTASDFFPFNYKTANGDLAGYNIDLARALCAELQLENICQIEAAPWDELQARLQAGAADALIAGLAPSAQNRAFLQFSRAYMRFPARFVALEGSALAADSAKFTRQGYDFSEFLLLRGASVKAGVLSGTAHEQMLRAYFAARPAAAPPPPAAAKLPFTAPPQAYRSSYRSGKAEHYTAGGKNALQLVSYPDRAALLAALGAKQIDVAFADGMGFALLINAQNRQKAENPPPAAAPPRLVFLGGAYTGIGYLGEGMRIAVRQNRPQLAAALNYALWQLERKGRLAELYLRYFPVGFY